MMTPRPKALIFDVFGTLTDWRNSIAGEARATLGLDASEADRFARAWRSRYQPSMQRIRSGERGYVRLDVLHRENLEDVLAEFSIEGLSASEIDHLNHAWHRLSPWPDVVPGLTRLKKHFIIAPCSNGNVSLMVGMAKHAGLPWDLILGAEPAQAYKPDPRVYLTAADWLDLTPEQVMMVAAHNDDLSAARKAGLMTAFFARPDEYGVEQNRDFEASDSWDFVARDLLDLADQMGA